MNYSEILLNKSIGITKSFINNENIKAIFVGGSVSRNLADEYSDLELFIIWKGTTNSEIRNSIFKETSYEILVSEEDEGDGEWTISVLMDGLKVDIYHWEEKFLDNLKRDVLENFDTSVLKQLEVSSILDCKVIKGEEYLNSMKTELLQYPIELVNRCLKQEALFESWSLRNVLLIRKDFVAIQSLINDTVLRLLRLLFAINSVYIRSNNFKWIDYQLSFLNRMPVNFKERLQFVATNMNEDGIGELDMLVKEVLSLAQNSYPDLNLSEEIKYLEYDRTLKKVS